MGVSKAVLTKFYQNKLDIGTRLRKHRKSLKLSSEQAAEMLEISISYYGLIERNMRTPSLETTLKICSVFKLSLDYFIYNDDTEVKEHPAIENWFTDLTPIEVDFLKVIILKIKAQKLNKGSYEFFMSFFDAYTKLKGMGEINAVD